MTSRASYRGYTVFFAQDPKTSGAIRVYLETEPYPNYQGRTIGAHTCHRFPANHDGKTHPPYICFQEGKKPRNVQDAWFYTQAWIDMTLKYIATGKTIDEQIRDGLQ
jgi:hypothetical protein